MNPQKLIELLEDHAKAYPLSKPCMELCTLPGGWLAVLPSDVLALVKYIRQLETEAKKKRTKAAPFRYGETDTRAPMPPTLT